MEAPNQRHRSLSYFCFMVLFEMRVDGIEPPKKLVRRIQQIKVEKRRTSCHSLKKWERESNPHYMGEKSIALTVKLPHN